MINVIILLLLITNYNRNTYPFIPHIYIYINYHQFQLILNKSQPRERIIFPWQLKLEQLKLKAINDICFPFYPPSHLSHIIISNYEQILVNSSFENSLFDFQTRRRFDQNFFKKKKKRK